MRISFAPSRTSFAATEMRLGGARTSPAVNRCRATRRPLTKTSTSWSAASSPLRLRYSFKARTTIAVSRVFDHWAPRRLLTSQVIAGSTRR